MIRNVDFGEQVLDHTDLVANFGSAQNGDERALGILKRAAEVFQFFLHQQAGGGFWTNLVMPTVEAWARCAVPKASFT